MTEKIEPALSAEEWIDGPIVQNRDIAHVKPSHVPGYVDFDINEEGVTPYTFAAGPVIAVANAALPDSDFRKITREMVNEIRQMARNIEIDYIDDPATSDHVPVHPKWYAFADALEAYLPPET